MASTPLYPESHDNLTNLLQEGAQIKQYVSTVTTKYAERLSNSPENFPHITLIPESRVLISANPNECTAPHLVVLDDEVVAEETTFKKAMRLYESTVDAKYKTGIDPDDEHTVVQLESLVEEAINQYQKMDSEGFWRKIRLAFRKLGESQDDIEGWLGVLPSENQYLSVICGGLKLIIKAAARLNEIREKVLESLENIPTLIDGAQRVSIMYKSDKLELLSKALYISLLAALGHILKYLNNRAKTSKTALKVMQAVMQPSRVDKVLQEKIEKVEKCVSAFEAEANICQKEQIYQAKQNIDATMNKLNEVERTMIHAAAGQNRLDRDMIDLITEIRRRQSDFGRDVSNLDCRLMERLITFLESGSVVRIFAQLMSEQMSNPQKVEIPAMETKDQSHAIPSTTRQIVQPAEAIHDQLLSQLDLDQRATRFDLTSIFNLGPKLSRDHQERSMFLIKAPKLTAWMESKSSTVLLVNGNIKRVQRQSGLTFVCARLAFAIEGIRSSTELPQADFPGLLPLYFFCGEHASCDRSWETPSGVLDSILGQLLDHMKRNGLSLDAAKLTHLNKSNKKGLKWAFKRFKEVLAQLPEKMTVFCIIDALSVYLDNNKTSKDAEQLIQQLLRLTQVKKPKGRYIFKLLLTAPNRFHSKEVNDLGEENVLTLPPTLPNKGGFTATKWHFSIGQQLESLEEA